MTRPLIGLLALQGDIAEHGRMFEAVGARVTKVRKAAELSALDGLLIPGGESTAMWRLAEDFDLLEPIADLISGGVPTYGSCAGLIMMATSLKDGRPDQRTFGGLDITVRRNAFGRQVASFEEMVAIRDVPGGPFPGVFIRAPWVESAGPAVEILGAAVDHGGNDRIVAVRQGRCLGTSFHPELTDDLRIHELFLRMVESAR